MMLAPCEECKVLHEVGEKAEGLALADAKQKKRWFFCTWRCFRLWLSKKKPEGKVSK